MSFSAGMINGLERSDFVLLSNLQHSSLIPERSSCMRTNDVRDSVRRHHPTAVELYLSYTLNQYHNRQFNS